MKMEHNFTVNASREEAFRLLTNVERVAPSLPGAELLGAEEDHYKARVKLKLGPIAAQYRGTVRIVEQDEADGRVVLRAEGRDSGGGGSAKATITLRLEEQAPETRVQVETDLAITGRVAQMGRGILEEVSGRMLGEFASNLQQDLGSRGGDVTTGGAPVTGDASNEVDAISAAPSGASVDSGAARSNSPPREAESVDLLAVVAVPLLRRAAPFLLGAVVVIGALAWFLR
jgi:uncharacterized protein